MHPHPLLATLLFFPLPLLAQSPTPCTSTITELLPWGCTLTVPGKTIQTAVNCQGCTLSTTSSVNAIFGLGPVCFGGRKTVTDLKLVKTVTECAPGTGAKVVGKKKGYGKEEL